MDSTQRIIPKNNNEIMVSYCYSNYIYVCVLDITSDVLSQKCYTALYRSDYSHLLKVDGDTFYLAIKLSSYAIYTLREIIFITDSNFYSSNITLDGTESPISDCDFSYPCSLVFNNKRCAVIVGWNSQALFYNCIYFNTEYIPFGIAMETKGSLESCKIIGNNKLLLSL